MSMDFGLSKAKNEKQESRKALLGRVESAEAYLREQLQSPHLKTLTPEGCLEFNHRLLKIIDSVLPDETDDSLFLKSTFKPLKKLKTHLLERCEALSQGQSDTVGNAVKWDKTKTCVYVSLYQANASSLHQWEALLRSLPSYAYGRAVYENVAEVEEAIRSKPQPNLEAYAVVEVNPEHILHNAPKRADKLGLPILNLDELAIKEGKVVMFVHMNERYAFEEGMLIKQVSES